MRPIASRHVAAAPARSSCGASARASADGVISTVQPAVAPSANDAATAATAASADGAFDA